MKLQYLKIVQTNSLVTKKKAIETNESGGKIYWNALAKENMNTAKTLRNIITFIIREQKQTNRIKNILK